MRFVKTLPYITDSDGPFLKSYANVMVVRLFAVVDTPAAMKTRVTSMVPLRFAVVNAE